MKTRNYYLTLLLLVSALFCSPFLQAQTAKAITQKPAEFKNQIEQTSKLCIIDIRPAADFAVGHIEGAVNMDPNDFRFIPELKRLCSASDTIFVYCKMGKTSKQATAKICSNGFQHVYSLKGGILAWEKKYPLVTE